MGSVRLEGVTKKFGKTEVLKDVDIDIKDKEFYCLLGPPGAGKTTIFRVIAGLEKPDKGKVYIDDLDVTGLPPRDRDVAMLFETLALYPTKTGYENIEFPLRLRKVPKAEREKRVREIARLLKIEHVLDRLPRTFSGGEQQRVALAKTIVRKPKAFLLDEPLSNIDALLRIGMRVEFKRLKRELGQTFIYATHDQTEAMSMSERICVIEKGVVHQIGRPLDLYNKPGDGVVAKIIGSPPMNLIDCTLIEEKKKTYLSHKAFRLDVTKFAKAIQKETTGPDLVLGVRPEDIHLSDRTLKDGIKTSIYVTEPLGAKIVVDLELGDHIIRAISSPTMKLDVGMEKWMRFDLDKIHIIDKSTEKTIL